MSIIQYYSTGIVRFQKAFAPSEIAELMAIGGPTTVITREGGTTVVSRHFDYRAEAGKENDPALIWAEDIVAKYPDSVLYAVFHAVAMDGDLHSDITIKWDHGEKRLVLIDDPRTFGGFVMGALSLDGLFDGTAADTIKPLMTRLASDDGPSPGDHVTYKGEPGMVTDRLSDGTLTVRTLDGQTHDVNVGDLTVTTKG